MENENSEPESLLFHSNFNSLEDGSLLWNDAVHGAEGPRFQTAPGTVCPFPNEIAGTSPDGTGLSPETRR